MKYQKITLTILALIFSATVFAQQDSILQLSLTEAQDYAIENNIEIINKELDIKKAKWQIWETTAVGLPQVNGSVEYQQFPDLPTTLMPNFLTPVVVGTNMQYFGLMPITEVPESGDMIEMQMGSEYNLNWGITVSQLLFSGEYFVGLQAARIFKSMSELSLEKSEIDLRTTIAQSYYLVLITEESLNILKESHKNIEKIVAKTEAMNEAGLIDKAQIDQMKFTELTLKNQITSMERQTVLTQRLLKFQLGLEMEDEIVLTDDLDKIINEQKFGEYVVAEFSLNGNIDYRMVQTQENITKLDLRRSQSKTLPTISAFYSYSENAMRDEFNFTDPDEAWFPTSVFGVNVSIPIFASGQRYAQIKQKQIELHKVQNQRTNLEQALTVQYEEAKNKYITAYETYLNDQENIRLAENIYNDTQIKFQSGTASSMELTQAQNQYLNAQAQYFQSLMNLLNEKANLEKLTK